MSCLLHNCFNETAETVSSNLQPPIDLCDNMDMRKQIMDLLLEKNSLEAIELTEQLSLGLLGEEHFHLLCLRFLELVCAPKCSPEALEFARTTLAPFGNVPKYVEKIQVKSESLFLFSK
ncbi:PREDICTED: uncharacterized protein LOC106343083 [Brassica oleracea var. oleracea]|uniref:uncharacterized protein LOC106343083 n=1 Tax=Brassica oleracea var. oleracea TaxID=109376 RepID=UPI0006A755BC|nr:PREDICTED: uncharacterized protein LOC106343083 [Brassica oleracea var. oleracea]